jgi:hypothetical protein
MEDNRSTLQVRESFCAQFEPKRTLQFRTLPPVSSRRAETMDDSRIGVADARIGSSVLRKNFGTENGTDSEFLNSGVCPRFSPFR